MTNASRTLGQLLAGVTMRIPKGIKTKKASREDETKPNKHTETSDESTSEDSETSPGPTSNESEQKSSFEDDANVKRLMGAIIEGRVVTRPPKWSHKVFASTCNGTNAEHDAAEVIDWVIDDN